MFQELDSMRLVMLPQPVNGNHLAGSERGLALSYVGLDPFILGLTCTVSVCVSM